MKNLLNYFFVFAMILSVASCSSDGEIGPQGEQGLQGEQGEQGPQGETGADGEAGNANVQVFTKDISGATWTVVGSGSRSHDQLDISAPNVLTRDVVDNWVILTYVDSSDYYTEWALLPYYTNRNIRVESEASEGRLRLMKSQNGTAGTQSNFYGVKIVIIEPSSTGEITRLQDTPVDYNDYEAVKAYYNLED